MCCIPFHLPFTGRPRDGGWPSGWLIVLTVLALTVAPGCTYETVNFPVRATVLETSGGDGGVPPSLRAGSLLSAGQSVNTGLGADERTSISLVPGTLVALGAGGELVLGELRFTKRGDELRGRHAVLALRAGTLDLLITAPEGAAPSELRVNTPMGELRAAPGCLLRVVAAASPPTRVTVLCARGSARWDGEPVPAGSLRTATRRADGGEGNVFTAARAAASVDAQAQLAALLEIGARLQGLELLRQRVPPGWRSNRPDR